MGRVVALGLAPELVVVGVLAAHLALEALEALPDRRVEGLLRLYRELHGPVLPSARSGVLEAVLSAPAGVSPPSPPWPRMRSAARGGRVSGVVAAAGIGPARAGCPCAPGARVRLSRQAAM